ncbi:hypothetical protein T4A_5980 [Trichinella pseudospiralis]|uniref:Uncharacterized protein n=1 Tax=Trichinella pseudospiralis TaxID=6337 RepID=A0A0V1AJW9_TRIPS|nr:hypothetical protein T4A_5980 [Trichinella pseudospiralis]
MLTGFFLNSTELPICVIYFTIIFIANEYLLI